MQSSNPKLVDQMASILREASPDRERRRNSGIKIIHLHVHGTLIVTADAIRDILQSVDGAAIKL